MHVRKPKGNLWERVLSFCSVGSGDGPQTIKLAAHDFAS